MRSFWEKKCKKHFWAFCAKKVNFESFFAKKGPFSEFAVKNGKQNFSYFSIQTSKQCGDSRQREYQNYKANDNSNFSQNIEGASLKQIWVCPKSILFYICGRKEFLFNIARNKLVKIPILSTRKSNLWPKKSKKRANLEFTDINCSFLQHKSIAN